MALLTFGRIRWKNLLSTGNDFIELNLDTTGTTLVVGENGAGKSQLLDALSFALFGKPFRNINKPQLINSITNKDLVVELDFCIGKNTYTILRGMRPNIFEVYCNDVLLNQNAEMKDYQEHLERKILKTNFKTFCQVVVLGSASFVPFMQLPAGQRRLIIEDLLDLQVFTVMNTLLKSQMQDNQDNIITNQSEQKLVSEKIKLLQSHLMAMRSKSEQFIKEKMNTLSDLELKILEINQIKQELSLEANHLLSKTSGVDGLKSKLDKMKSIRTQIEAKSALLTKEIKFFEHNDNCPTCKQTINTTFSCEIVNQRSTEITNLEDGLSQLSDKYQTVQSQLQDILELDRQYDTIRSQLSHESLKLRMYNDQITAIKTEIQEAENDVVDSGEVKVSDLETNLNSLTSTYIQLQDDKQLMSVASAMLKDGGIKTKIINQYIPIINKLINKYLSDFDLFVEFNLDDQFNEIIKSRHRDVFSYDSFSEGEKQKINLAILFTWRAVAKLRNSLNTNLLILDEIMDGAIDSDGLDNMQKIFGSLTGSNIFVISHREGLQDKFNHTIKFVKHKNFSKIEGQ